ncbi:DUF2628 domain-containing protein [Deltaproteobacteria bacterium OttesenSCG-928-M10]|nr:DUF2628 domain-containing protein [Deltaproteobacteria bacterium OttesenSCG-928-M10]
MNEFNDNHKVTPAAVAPAGPWRVDGGDRGPRQLSLSEVRELYVGGKYYRFARDFELFDEQGGLRPTFSVPAFFLGAIWFVYRKMYIEALAVCLAAVGMQWLAGLFNISEGLASMTSLGVAVFLALIAKNLYWKAVDRKIAQAMNLYPNDPPKAVAWLQGQGGTNLIGALVFAFVLFAIVYYSVAAFVAGNPELMMQLQNTR